MKHAVIIGGGIGGLGAACLLSKKGFRVTLLDEHDQVGGRARVFEEGGFRFDMGPSWYLMPDVFSHFFELMEERVEDHLELTRLSPSYRIYFKDEDQSLDIDSDVSCTEALFEQFEQGAGAVFKEYLKRSGEQYAIAKQSFMYRNYASLRDLLSKDFLTHGRKLYAFSTMDRYVKKFFSSPILQKILQYQLVFLGSSPYKTPALYSIMNFIDFSMGVFYPKGGIHAIPRALLALAQKHGTHVRMNSRVQQIIVAEGKATGVVLEGGERIKADLVISNADVAYTDTNLLPSEYRMHADAYWKSRTLAPSAFILYLGVDGTLPSLTHHTLLFSKDWKKNFGELFDTPSLPSDPSLYVCNPSKTDNAVAPIGKENLFVLVPVGAGVSYTAEALDAYQDHILGILERDLHIPNLKSRIEVCTRYTPEGFVRDYHSLGGSALGLAHTLTQTAFFRPDNGHKKVKDLWYVGAGTNPGIGMPTCLISAELVYKRIMSIKHSAPLSSL